MGLIDEAVVESEENLVLPPPPAVIPNNVKLEMPQRPKYAVMTRRGIGRSGKRIPLHANHFKVSVDVPDAVFYQYTVSICYEDDKEANVKGIGRQLMNKLYQTYSSEFSGKKFAYDGEKSLYTVGPLPQKKFEFTVVLEESSAAKVEDGNPGLAGSPKEGGKRSKRSFNSKTFKIELSYAAKIPMKSIALALKGADADHSTQDALRVLDIILRQQAANRGCLLVRQSFFHDDVRNFTDVGGGVAGVRGFHASFRTTQDGLSLNMDVSTTMILQPGPVTDFLRANQGVRENRYIDWVKAKRMLKNMRIKTSHQSMEFKIIGLSELPCNKLFFPFKVKNGGGVENDGQTEDITVYEYFTRHRNIELGESAYMPCLIVGRPKKPNYLPIELCTLVSLQRYTKALSSIQRTALVEKSRQKPQEKTKILTDAINNYQYDKDPLLGSCGISIEKRFIKLEGRVLDPPKLKFGENNESFPNQGRWNFNNKTVFDPVRIDKWIVVNFSARCDMSRISRDLISCGRKKGIQIEGPFTLIDEELSHRRASPVARVEKMFERIRAKVPGPPTFILCILSERKTCDVYGPWKKKCLSDFGIVTQCISPFKVNDQYLTNVLLKINAKLGGMNSMLAIEHPSHVPVISDTPTLILGMDVSHGSPGRSDLPSIAAVVGSRYWPSISKYGASVRTQSPKTEMIDALYKPLPNGNDDGIISELLVDFYQTSNRKPSQIIIFRDGVSESQFNQVLNIELDQIIQAYHHLKETNIPKFTVIVAQKNHHTKLFQAENPGQNIPPGTIVDTRIVHPRNNDFYLCSHMGMIGTSRPAHYHVLLDEIGFAPDDLQNLIHSLSYVYQRSTTAISIVAPICYAHLAAYQMGQFIKFEDLSDTASGQKSASSAGTMHVPELPRLHKNIKSSMFFC